MVEREWMCLCSAILFFILICSNTYAYPAIIDPELLTIGDESQTFLVYTEDTAIYKYGYYSVAGSPWTQFTLSPGSSTVGNWHFDSAYAIEPFGKATTPSTNNLIALYSCTYSTAWDCHGNQWQFYQFEITDCIDCQNQNLQLQIVSAQDAGTAQVGNPTVHGYDGDMTTRWALEGIPTEIVFDLGTMQEVNEFRFSYYRWQEDRVYTFSLDTSLDGTSWSSAVPQKNSQAIEWNIERFSTRQARYVRLTYHSGTTAGEPTQWAGLWEAQVWGNQLNAVPNTAPTVDAGGARQTTSSQTTLAGSVTDDGLLLSAQYTWKQLSGPATATISSPTSTTTNVALPTVGTYVFELEAYDGEYTSSDTVEVRRNEESGEVVFDDYPSSYVAPGGWSDVTWEDPGISNWQVIDVTTRGVAPNSGNVRGAFASLLNSLNQPTILYFPAGTYEMRGGNIHPGSNVILRGAGPEQTIIRYPDGDVEIAWYGSLGTETSVTQGVEDGGKTVPVASTSGFAVGNIVDISERLDTYKEWGERSGGAIAKITSINPSAKTITINVPLANGLRTSKNPTVRKMNPKQNIGIENIRFENLKNKPGTDQFVFQRVYNAFIRNVEAYKTGKHHVTVTSGHNILIQDSFFDDAHGKGTGGFGYGAIIQDRSTYVRVENNIFRNLRHQLGVQTGPSYVIFAYNLNVDTFRDQCMNNPPSWCSSNNELLNRNAWRESDFVVHGHYPHHVLFEGNIGYYVFADNVHHDNGPNNVFFRNLFLSQPNEFGNWAEGHGFAVHGPNDKLVVVGNVFANGGTFWPRDTVARDMLIGANVRNGQVIWGVIPEASGLPGVRGLSSEANLPASLYRTSPPSFWGSQPWPPFGPENVNSEDNKIPAQQRYLSKYS